MLTLQEKEDSQSATAVSKQSARTVADGSSDVLQLKVGHHNRDFAAD